MNTDDDNQSIDLDDLDFDEEDIKQLDEAVTTYLQTQQTQQRPWDQKAAATQDGQRQASTYHTIAAGYVTDGPFVKQEPDDKQDSRRIIEDLQHRIQALEFDKQMLERKLNEQTKREKIVSEAEQILTKKKKRTNPGTPTITHSPAVAGTQQLPPSNRGSTQTSFPTVAPAWKPKNRRKRAESPHSAFSLSNETSKMTLHSQMRAAPQGDEEDDHAISTATVVPTTHDVKSCSASGMVLPDHAESSRLYKDGPSLSQTQRTSTSMSIEEEPPLKIAKVPVKQADDPYSALNGTPSFRSITSTPTTPFIPFPSNEAYRDLLQLIFEDIYLEWNRTRHKYTKNYLMAFTPENIQQWSEQYASYFTDIPSTLTLDKIHEQRLNMIASEIRYYLSGQIQDANVIIRSLIIQFGYCLPICIQYKLYTIIECISMTLARITASWHQAVQQQQQQQQQQHQQQFHTVALQQLYNEMISHRSHAVLYQLVQCLSLFTFKYHNDRKPSPLKQQIITEKYADLLREDITYTEIMTLVNQHQTYPSVINAAIEAKLTPKEAYSTKSIQCILEVLTRVSRQYPNKPIFLFILTDEGFLKLLSEETPMEILFSCLIVIQAMLNGNKDWSTVDGDGLFEKEQELQCGMKGIHSEAAMEKAKVVPEVMKRLTDLLHLSKGSYTWQKWYQLRRMICTVLCGLCQVNLSPRILPLCQKHVFIRIMELMRECCKFDERSKSQKEIKEHRLLVRDGFDTIGKILKYARPAGLFEYDSHFTVMTCLDLVNYYLEFVVTSTTTTSTTMTAAGKHPAKRVLLAIEQILEDEKKKQQHQQQHQQQQQQPQPSLKKEIGKVQPGPSDVIYISSP